MGGHGFPTEETSAVVNGLLGTERTVIGEGVFSYWQQGVEAGSAKTAWLLFSYDTIGFLGMTAPS